MKKTKTDSINYETRKLEFNAYKNTLRRLINQAKNCTSLVNLLNKGEMAEKHGKQLTVLYIENPIKLHRTLY